jgi:DNA mismatch endonuclease (patch repair protein)
MMVRRVAHNLGYRFRLQRKDLPGRPDLVFPRFRQVILVHGCFWHQHPGCREGRVPGSNTNYWAPKLERNVERDRDAEAALAELGWRNLVIWECECRDANEIGRRIADFLGRP